MELFLTIDSIRAVCSAMRKNGKRIALVPTMGFLHEGHMSLVRKARELSDCVVMSIYVNPTQFSPGEDFERYPRDTERDLGICRSNSIDMVFMPDNAQMYFDSHSTFVDEVSVSKHLCGAVRPGHFRGVLTVVSKLFNIIQPDIAVFGQKDAQQAALIDKMARELNMPVQVVISPTVREADGLALSSRNVYLSAEERTRALSLNRSLKVAEQMFSAGERDAVRLVSVVKDLIEQSNPASIDYVEAVDYSAFARCSRISGKMIIVVAARYGQTRLIDNVILDPHAS